MFELYNEPQERSMAVDRGDTPQKVAPTPVTESEDTASLAQTLRDFMNSLKERPAKDGKKRTLKKPGERSD